MADLESVSIALPQGRVEGYCDAAFRPVLDRFVANFQEHGEVGASVCLIHDGRTLVDLWGGIADRKTEAPWTRDTVSIVFSCTKGATALCAHILRARGLLDIDAPVAEIWPEFATNGKERATVRMMLDHSVGVPVFREKVKQGGLYDWDYAVGLLAAQAPFWEPGTRNGYHGLTFGWTVGEIVRRISGKSLGTFFQDEVAKPLGLDFWIGLPEEIEPRVAPMIPYIPPPDAPKRRFIQALVGDPNSLPALFWLNTGGHMQGGVNTRAGRAAEIGAANGITNARGLAGMYAPLAAGGGSLVDPTTLASMGEVSMATHDDATLLIPTRFALGFMVSMDNRRRTEEANSSVILGRRAFGHVGAGGSIGFCDPECGLAFAYTMNRMGEGILMNERGQSLVDAAYRCLGYRDDSAGYWRR